MATPTVKGNEEQLNEQMQVAVDLQFEVMLIRLVLKFFVKLKNYSKF